MPNIDEFARLGESASQTFSRLNQEVTATDAILLAMGKNAAEAFYGCLPASIAARENLIDPAGAGSAMNKTQSYYANFTAAKSRCSLRRHTGAEGADRRLCRDWPEYPRHP